MKSFTKGSKPYWRILEHGDNSKLNIVILNTVETFFKLINTPKLTAAQLKLCWGAWNCTFYGNRQREFLYKFFNNILGLNIRVNKFVAGHPAECTLCTVGKEPAPVMAESFLHLFFDCQYSSRYRAICEELYFPEIINGSQEQKRLFWFTGRLPNDGEGDLNLFMQCAVMNVNFAIWNMKLMKMLMPMSTFKADFLYNLKNCSRRSAKIRESRDNGHYFLCREPP